MCPEKSGFTRAEDGFLWKDASRAEGSFLGGENSQLICSGAGSTHSMRRAKESKFSESYLNKYWSSNNTDYTSG